VTWDELGPRLQPNQWTVKNFAQRLKTLRGEDPWKGYLSSKQALTASMLKAVGAA
jgi:DNA primase